MHSDVQNTETAVSQFLRVITSIVLKSLHNEPEQTKTSVQSSQVAKGGKNEPNGDQHSEN